MWEATATHYGIPLDMVGRSTTIVGALAALQSEMLEYLQQLPGTITLRACVITIQFNASITKGE